MPRLTARAPLRIDLAGGWSDIPPFAVHDGGAVVTVAIGPHVEAELTSTDASVDVRYGLRAASGSGLGTSGALSVAWMALMRHATGGDVAPTSIAEGACAVATAIGVTGGKQDEYASALGGVQLLRFTDQVVADALVDAEAHTALLNALVVCHSGIARLSAGLHDRVWGAHADGNSEVLAVLTRLRDCAESMAPLVRRADLGGIGACMTENWDLQRRLDASISNQTVDQLIEEGLRAGALGAKACGAGGGGCLAFVVEPGRREDVVTALGRAGGHLVAVSASPQGVVVSSEENPGQ